jgi:hypothetical protein
MRCFLRSWVTIPSLNLAMGTVWLNRTTARYTPVQCCPTAAPSRVDGCGPSSVTTFRHPGGGRRQCGCTQGLVAPTVPSPPSWTMRRSTPRFGGSSHSGLIGTLVLGEGVTRPWVSPLKLASARLCQFLPFLLRLLLLCAGSWVHAQ